MPFLCTKYANEKLDSITVKLFQDKLVISTYTRDEYLIKNAMIPIFVLDYIVVHEMCHMEYKNHSKNFWNRACPK